MNFHYFLKFTLLSTPKIGTVKISWAIWANRSDRSCTPVRTVWANFSNYQLDYTIAYISSRQSKCIYRTSNLVSEWRSYGSRKTCTLTRPVQGQSNRLGDQSDWSEQPNSSYELYFDIWFVRVSTSNRYRSTAPPYKYKGLWPIETHPIESIYYASTFCLQTLNLFQPLQAVRLLISTTIDGPGNVRQRSRPDEFLSGESFVGLC